MNAARRSSRWPRWGVALAWLSACAGCHSNPIYFHNRPAQADYRALATTIDVPDVNAASAAEVEPTLEPRTLWNGEKTEYWDLSLEEAVQIALANSSVMRDLGGRVLAGGNLAKTVYDPSIVESDPRFGVEGTLAAFDAQLNTQMFWEKNDRVLNNLFTSGGQRFFQQDTGNFAAQVSKVAATGTQFALRNHIDYDGNNRPVNLFPSVWDVDFEAEFRHPLLQGAGVEFNRIAGPGATPGLFGSQGVVLARLDNDVALTEFEAAVRDLVSSVETSYWELYFAYRDLDAKIAARDAALATWRRASRLLQAGGLGGDVETEAQASAQYLYLKSQVQEALSGTANLVASQPGTSTFQGTGGVFARENDLRLLLGLSGNDGRQIRPRDEPTAAKIAFDWQQALTEGVMRRVELRRQQWIIKRREMELIAARNFLLPRLDFTGRYRWRGFGDDLLRSDNGPLPRFDNAFQTLTDGDFQEWQLGMQMDVPIGFRRGYAAVRNAQLRLSRERAVLDEQERQVAHDLAAAVRELHRAYEQAQTGYNLRFRQQARVDAVRRKFESGTQTVDALLDAQQDLAEAEAGYYRALVSYNVAIKAVHFQKGSLLDYNQIYLAEGPWPAQAYRNATQQARGRAAARYLNYGITKPREFVRGPYAQITSGAQPAEFHQLPAAEPIPLPPPSASMPAPDESPTKAAPGGQSLHAIETPRAMSPPLPAVRHVIGHTSARNTAPLTPPVALPTMQTTTARPIASSVQYAATSATTSEPSPYQTTTPQRFSAAISFGATAPSVPVMPAVALVPTADAGNVAPAAAVSGSSAEPTVDAARLRVRYAAPHAR